MKKETLRLLGVIIGTLVFMFFVIPSLYTLLMPITFWQNFVMLFTVDIFAYLITVGVFEAMFENLGN